MEASVISGSSMPAEMQIDAVLKEGIGNVVLAVMGIADLGFDDFIYKPVSSADGKITRYEVMAKVTDQIAQLTFRANVPVRHPDSNFLLYGIADETFMVNAGIGRNYEVWCEHNPYTGSIAIVQFVTASKVTWAVVGGLDDTIFHMDCPHAELDERFQRRIMQHWPNPE
jgi:hypothetical protein